ncbi:MAG: GH25 family lysozyme [Firmicutes bacterium]|nr:GH25 family lysozyme [Bacillota bacterium]
MRRLFTFLIALCLAFSVSVPVSLIDDDSGSAAFAAKATKENKNAQMGHSIKRLKTSKDNEDVVYAARVVAVGENGGEELTKFFKDYQSGYLVGIDVSYWQGNINWDKVAGEVDFAILRCGYGKNVKSKDDSTFEKNARACEERGIPYGVYLYSYANTVAKAEDEADHCLRLLKGHEPDLPIYYDLEDKEVSKAGSTRIKKMAKAFCKRITENGYKAGVYASLSWWQSKLGTSADGYSKWVAQWNTSCSASEAQIWQFSSNGTVPGISGRVDMNEMMIPKSEMDTFMEGAYTKFSGQAKNVDDYEAIVLENNVTVKMGPGTGFRTSGTLRAGTKINVSETYNGYAHLTDGKGVNIKKLEGGITEGGTPEYQGSSTEDEADSWIPLDAIAF